MKIRPYLDFISFDVLVKLPPEFRDWVDVSRKRDIIDSAFVENSRKKHPTGWHFEMNYARDNEQYLMHVANNRTAWHPVCQILFSSDEDAAKISKWFPKVWLYKNMNVIRKES